MDTAPTIHYMGGSEPNRLDEGDYIVTYISPNGTRTVIAETKSWAKAKWEAERHNPTPEEIRWLDALGAQSDGMMFHALGKYEIRPRA